MKLFARQKSACRVTQRSSSRLMDGAVLSVKEEKQREAHLLACPACQRNQADLWSQSGLLRGKADLVSTLPEADGVIAARAVSIWRGEQKKLLGGFLSPRAQKQLTFGLAASVALAGAGVMSQIAKNEPVKTATQNAAPWAEDAPPP